jgi:hypothetical protein
MSSEPFPPLLLRLHRRFSLHIQISYAFFGKLRRSHFRAVRRGGRGYLKNIKWAATSSATTESDATLAIDKVARQLCRRRLFD